VLSAGVSRGEAGLAALLVGHPSRWHWRSRGALWLGATLSVVSPAPALAQTDRAAEERATPTAPPALAAADPSSDLRPATEPFGQAALAGPSAPQAASFEPALLGGQALLGAGLSGLIAGAVAFGVGDMERASCGYRWYMGAEGEPCPQSQDDFPTKQAGAGILFAGAASSVFAVASLIAGALDGPHGADGVAQATSGLVLTGLGAASVVGGAASWVAMLDHYSNNNYAAGGAVAAGIGVLAMAVGVPLWIDAAEPPMAAPPAERVGAPATGDERVKRSPPMIAAGVVLLALGTAGGGSSIYFAITARSPDVLTSTEWRGHAVAPQPLIATYTGCAATLFAIAGTALVAWGATDVQPNEAPASSRSPLRFGPPEVSIGPAAAELRWRF
jgi:hypothetical protein